MANQRTATGVPSRLGQSDTRAVISTTSGRLRTGRAISRIAAPPGALRYSRMASPIGQLLLAGRPGVLTGLYLADHERCPPAGSGWVEDDDALHEARAQLAAYFAGTRTAFDLEIDPAGTAFQLSVWRALVDIPFGQTISYGELARRVGRPTTARAVGAANGQNPISLVVPCHRVIGSDGTLTGYGWGNDCKAWLLDHERAGSVLPFGS